MHGLCIELEEYGIRMTHRATCPFRAIGYLVVSTQDSMANTPPLDWSQFSVRIPIPADPKAIATAWLSQEGLERWFLSMAEFVQPNGELRRRDEPFKPGDTYRWRWFGYPHTETGEVLETNEGDFVRFVFGKAGIVSVGIDQENDESILRLKQEEIPTDDEARMNWYAGCKSGWTFYMCNLKSLLLGGPDLRNKNENLTLD